jgi:signal transduction histidine kinase
MRIFKFPGAAIFRRTLAIAALFVGADLLLFAFIYWQTAVFETNRIMTFLERQAQVLAQAPFDDINQSIQKQTYNDVHRLTVSGLFEPDGAVLQGNLATLPVDLAIDGAARRINQPELRGDAKSPEPMIIVARGLSDGRILVIGRNIEELGNLEETVGRALKLGVIPMALLAIAVGAILSQRMNRRFKAAQQALDKIQKGQLHQRLPVSESRDEFDHLAEGVNVMLGEFEWAIEELHQVGNNIAHNLRTPLTRVRTQLERAQRLVAAQIEPLQLIERAISGLDQTFSITTTMLRIAQIESGRNRASFGTINLAEIMQEAAELYDPVAEAKQILIERNLDTVCIVWGDRDFLLEAFANLLDNAIKFTPDGGAIQFSLRDTSLGAIVEVRDTGPGIPVAQRTDVFKRFYRCKQSQHTAGAGLGLTLVAAIVKIHGFSIQVKDASPGCDFEIRCFAGKQFGAGKAVSHED